MSLLPSQCRCGADGYLTPTAPEGAGEPPNWRYVPVPDAAPVEPPPRQYSSAVHEVGHAVLAHLVGFKIESVTVDNQPFVAWTPSPNNHLASAAVALAGNHAERLIFQRFELRPDDAGIVEGFRIVRDFRFGGCDRCQSAFAIVASHGLDASDAELLASYRQIENLTISTLQTPRVRAAVRRFADALMRAGTIAGPDAHETLTDAGLCFASLTIPHSEGPKPDA